MDKDLVLGSGLSGQKASSRQRGGESGAAPPAATRARDATRMPR